MPRAPRHAPNPRHLSVHLSCPTPRRDLFCGGPHASRRVDNSAGAATTATIRAVGPRPRWYPPTGRLCHGDAALPLQGQVEALWAAGTALDHPRTRRACQNILKLAPALWTFVETEGVEPTNNAAERALRGIALGRRAWLFAGSDRGGERAAAIYTLIATAKLNGVDPQAWLADILGRIADHPASRLAELLPWNWKDRAAKLAA